LRLPSLLQKRSAGHGADRKVGIAGAVVAFHAAKSHPLRLHLAPAGLELLVRNTLLRSVANQRRMAFVWRGETHEENYARYRGLRSSERLQHVPPDVRRMVQSG
jgi:hypothetical protein